MESEGAGDEAGGHRWTDRVSRKIEPGLWKLFDPARGTIWMGCWGDYNVTTHYEAFARRWLALAQSQNVISGSAGGRYAEAANSLTQ
jgi:hypothetical protein